MKRLFSFYREHQERLTSVAFVLGFVWDGLTLTRIDLFYENFVFGSYLAIAAGSILTMHLGVGGAMGERARVFARFLPLVLQFAYGGLFSGFFIFYSRSGSLASSWPFVLALVLLLIGNERFRGRYERFTFQIAILFITLYSYLIFLVPVVTGRMGAVTFLTSGVAALACISLFVSIFSRVVPGLVARSRARIIRGVAAITVLMNALYFLNIMPPVPLSLKDIGVYHDVSRTSSGDYELTYEPSPWYEPFSEASGTFHRAAGEPVYAWSAVFAPTRITVGVRHRWQYFNDESRTWVTESVVNFPISGGRDGGYRGYTIKGAVREGKWRVAVETSRGQLIGRRAFNIVPLTSPITLETVAK